MGETGRSDIVGAAASWHRENEESKHMSNHKVRTARDMPEAPQIVFQLYINDNIPPTDQLKKINGSTDHNNKTTAKTE